MTDLFDHAERSENVKLNITKGRKRAVNNSSALQASKEKNSRPPKSETSEYSAKDIEVLEGLEAVRRRPGMFIGGTDERALHHLAAEILDNSMDEAVAGFATRIDIELEKNMHLIISDNGRGIPTDNHPKFKTKSALEVILTTLHSGGKFSGDSYNTAGGLHGVGLSVVNALSDFLKVEVARDRKIWSQTYAKGKPQEVLREIGNTNNRRGTKIIFHPDPTIFDEGIKFDPSQLYRMARSKAYLFRGVEIRWKCDTNLIKPNTETPEKAVLRFPGGLSDYLNSALENRKTITIHPFSGNSKLNTQKGKTEWAAHWPLDEGAFFYSYCNTVPTPLGGTHEQGFKAALAKGLRNYGELTNVKQASKIIADDIVGGACIILSVFISSPQFQGQTKERLSTIEAQKFVDSSVRDHFDHWLSSDPDNAKRLLEHVINRAEIRLKKRFDKQTKRQSATKRLRLPGKLTDCSKPNAEGTELFIVEGDSAGGSAKQARNRENQAVLPLRGKILNVASASTEKLNANQELADLIEALGCGTGDTFIEDDLRYEKIIIMTDADVDGAHISSLLITFFYKKIPGLIEKNHLYLAIPPLYRISQGAKTLYARDDSDRDHILETQFANKGKVEISRFKGLGEMPSKQLKETTMDPEKRILLRITVPSEKDEDSIIESKNTSKLVDSLMGKRPELRFKFIQEKSQFLDASHLDV